MENHTIVRIGKMELRYKNQIPDFYIFFLKKENNYTELEDSDNQDIGYKHLGYKTTCSNAKLELEHHRYTIKFIAEIYEFFEPHLLDELGYKLETLKVDINSIDLYLKQDIQKSSIDKMNNFVKYLGMLLYSAPPFNLQIENDNKIQTAEEFLDKPIDIQKFIDYMVRNYLIFPPCVITISLLFDKHSYLKADFHEVIDLIFSRLILEASHPDEEFSLNIAGLLESNEINDIENFLEQQYFFMAHRLSEKIIIHNKVFRALFTNENHIQEQYIKSRCQELLKDCDNAKTNNEKGRLLEDLVKILFTSSNFMVFEESRVSTGDEEIDLLVKNNIENRPFWNNFHSPLFFIECKNWKKQIGSDELRNFEGKLRNHEQLVKIGFFVGLAGFTREAKSHLIRMSRGTQRIVLITRKDIESFISSDIYFIDWLEKLTAKVY